MLHPTSINLRLPCWCEVPRPAPWQTLFKLLTTDLKNALLLNELSLTGFSKDSFYCTASPPATIICPALVSLTHIKHHYGILLPLSRLASFSCSSFFRGSSICPVLSLSIHVMYHNGVPRLLSKLAPFSCLLNTDLAGTCEG
jgi:hypothetical protein